MCVLQLSDEDRAWLDLPDGFIDELADFWPDMDDVEEGEDMFSEYPVASSPAVAID